jgi:nucleoside-diphosphate-sugar epimerase
VTGATGFIGSRLAQKLHQLDWRVRALVLPGEDASHIRPFIADLQEGDLLEPDTLLKACDEVDVVFHLAARVTDWGSRQSFYSAILQCTRNILDQAVGRARRFVYVSSIAACGLGRHLKGFNEDSPAIKTGVPYGDAKLDTEQLVLSRHGMSGLEVTIVRPANVIGPGSVWVRDVVAQYRRLGMPLIDQGRHGASLVEVGNLVQGMVQAGLRERAAGRTYFLRDDWPVTWKRYLTDLGQMLGKRPGLSIPFWLAWNGGRVLEALVTPLGKRPPLTRLVAGVMGRDNDVDTSRAAAELDYLSSVDYRQAMADIHAWLTP